MTAAYNLSQLANHANSAGELDLVGGTSGILPVAKGGTGSSTGGSFPSGTRMSFNQTAAPTGWTKDTSITDSIMRITSGTVGSGGSVAFSTWNASSTTGAHTLTTAEIPSHTHGLSALVSSASGTVSGFAANTALRSGGLSILATGGGGAHSHPMTASIKYNDFIIASKD